MNYIKLCNLRNASIGTVKESFYKYINGMTINYSKVLYDGSRLIQYKEKNNLKVIDVIIGYNKYRNTYNLTIYKV